MKNFARSLNSIQSAQKPHSVCNETAAHQLWPKARGASRQLSIHVLPSSPQKPLQTMQLHTRDACVRVFPERMCSDTMKSQLLWLKEAASIQSGCAILGSCANGFCMRRLAIASSFSGRWRKMCIRNENYTPRFQRWREQIKCTSSRCLRCAILNVLYNDEHIVDGWEWGGDAVCVIEGKDDGNCNMMMIVQNVVEQL